MLSSHPLLLYQFLSTYHTFFALSNFCYVNHPLLSPHLHVPSLQTKQHNSPSRLIECAPPAPIHISISTGVFGHRAVMMALFGERREGYITWLLETHHFKSNLVDEGVVTLKEVVYKAQRLFLLTPNLNYIFV